MSNLSKCIFAVLTKLPGVKPEAAKSLSETLSINTVMDLSESPHFTYAADLSEALSNPGHTLRRFGIPGGRVIKAFEN